MSDAIHRRAALLAIGDELLTGQSLDTNTRWLAARLAALGIEVVRHELVGDDTAAIRAAVARLADECDLVLCTGGLGPTLDDLVRDALAALVDEPLQVDPELERTLRAAAAARGRTLNEGDLLQTQRPASARPIANHRGTAPGLAVTLQVDGRPVDVVALPGPPVENQPMFDAAVVPALRPPPGGGSLLRLVHHYGIPESTAAERLGPLLERGAEPLVGITASDGVVTCRIRATGDAARARDALDRIDAEIDAAIGAHRFAVGEGAVHVHLVRALLERREGVVVAESCTGGLLGARLSALPGASGALLGGWIVYANAHKAAHLGVPRELLGEHGAVSGPVAEAMARGALDRLPAPDPELGLRAVHALAITGVAGPGGGTDDKPVGTVWIAHARRVLDAAGLPDPGTDHVRGRRFHFPGDRERIRARAASAAAGVCIFHLLGKPLATPAWATDVDAERGRRS